MTDEQPTERHLRKTTVDLAANFLLEGALDVAAANHRLQENRPEGLPVRKAEVTVTVEAVSRGRRVMLQQGQVIARWAEARNEEEQALNYDAHALAFAAGCFAQVTSALGSVMGLQDEPPEALPAVPREWDDI